MRYHRGQMGTREAYTTDTQNHQSLTVCLCETAKRQSLFGKTMGTRTTQTKWLNDDTT